MVRDEGTRISPVTTLVTRLVTIYLTSVHDATALPGHLRRCILLSPLSNHPCRFARGEAFAAEDGHPAQDWGAAAACYVRALDLDHANPLYSQRLADAATELNHLQLTGVLDAVYVTRGGLQGSAALELGMSDATGNETVHRCSIQLELPRVRRRDVGIVGGPPRNHSSSLTSSDCLLRPFSSPSRAACAGHRS